MKTLNDNIKPILALFIVGMGFTYFFMCAIFNVEQDPQTTIAIVSLMSMAAGYYFGSSTGAAKKDETISDLAKKQ